MADDDLYSGYGGDGPLAAGFAPASFGPPGTASAAMAAEAFFRPASRSGAAFDQAPSHAQMRLGTAISPSTGQMRLGTAVAPSYAQMRLGTAIAPGTARLGTASSGDSGARPMTSNKGAGYRSTPRGRFDPLNQAASGAANALDAKLQASPEELCLEAEAKVHAAMEQSAEALANGDASAGLERAKEAGKRERAVCKLRERFGLLEQINSDLTYAVAVNLAEAYHAAQLYSEALNSFTQIVRSKQFPQAHLLRINMGNIHFEQQKYPSAIKMYRMALDQVPLTSRSVRNRILRNIGVAFMKVGQYQDAMHSMNGVLDAEPDPQAAFNLVLCTFALGDKEMMKQAFSKLVEVVPSNDLEDADDEEQSSPSLLNDELRQEMRARQAKMHSYILTAARLISPVIERSGPVPGFDWCIEALTAAQHSALASEVALAKAGWFLDHQAFGDAVSVLKEFERKEHKLKARAATNLAFLYSLEGDSSSAKRYADLAMTTDKYSAQALVNKGNIAARAGDLMGARAHFMDAVSLEADCMEAIYNLGLVSKGVGNLDDALTAFKRLNAMLTDDTAAMFQIAAVYDLMGDPHGALEWFERLNMRVPQDPGVLARLGALHARLGDEAEAVRCYQDAHRMFPANMDVISWLGAFHVKNEMYEKAAPFFELAAQVQPQEVKWQLMVASCFRRTGNQQQALLKYKQIHSSHPLNVECLRYLVNICGQLGLKPEEADFVARLRKAERQRADPRVSNSRESLDDHAQPTGQSLGHGLTADLAVSTAPIMPEEPAFQMPLSKAKKAQMVAKRDDDEWGTGDLGEELLPQ
ncbi:hypothetical protein WJX79_003743 [Trebouxia sp. C0005]